MNHPFPNPLFFQFEADSADTVTLSQNGTSLVLPVQVSRMVSEGVAVLPRNLAKRPAEKLVGPSGLYATVKVEKGGTE